MNESTKLAEPLRKALPILALILALVYCAGAHLSVLPLLATLVFWGMLASATKFSSGAVGRVRLRTVAAALLVGIVFLLAVSPYLHTSKQRFGRWFYNVNTSIYMWADSWDEVNQVMTGSGDREHWPEVPEQLLPSPTRYLEQHSLADVASRLAAGFWASELRHLLQKPFGYGKYLIFYSLIALAAAIRWREQVSLVCIKDGRWIQTGFVLTVVLGYLIAYAFYSPIVRGPRLALSLYLPTMFSIFWMLSHRELTGQPLLSNERFALRLFHVHVSALVVLGYDIAFRLPHIIVTTPAGG